MSKTIKDYFLAEMQLLNESTQHFAQKNPLHAARLNIDTPIDRDPHIERLLEGSAYLQARVKQQLDLGVHHITESLLRQLAPHYLTPYPSNAIIEFTSQDDRYVRPQSIPPGIKLSSDEVGEEHTTCEFTTIKGLTLQPVQLATIEIKQMSDQVALHLGFILNDGVIPHSIDLAEIPLFINTTQAVASQWYFNLTHNVRSVIVRHANGQEQPIGSQAHIEGMHFSDYQTLASPQSECQIDALSLLTDYFQFQERFSFIKLTDIGKLVTQTFEIIIAFKTELSDLRTNPTLFKLHCVPASNIFNMQCEPIRHTNHRNDYPLIPSHSHLKSKQLYALQRVTGIDKHAMITVDFSEFHTMQPLANSGYYRVNTLRESDDTASSRILFSGNLPETMHVSCEALAYNGHYPRQYLSSNALFLKDERLSSSIRATNISKPSRHFYPVFNTEYASRVLASINARFHMFAKVAFLKKILHLHDWSNHAKQQIEALTDAQLHPLNRLQKGMMVRGVSLIVGLTETSFPSKADIYLFGCVLHHFVKAFAPFNTFVETTLNLLPSGECLNWKQHQYD